jgi:hypothetical protein
MNESRPLEANLVIWSARNRWMFRAVGALLGLIWGLLGVAVQALLVRNEFPLPWAENPGVIGLIVGMVFGVGHASQFWLARAGRPARSWWLEVLVWAVVCVALGILWSSPLVLVLVLSWLGYSSIFEAVRGLERALVLEFLGRALLFVSLSVVPAGLLMAPLAVLVWRKTTQALHPEASSILFKD